MASLGALCYGWRHCKGLFMWRFVHLSDLHLASERDGEWNNRFLCSMMPSVMGCLSKDLCKLGADFVLATGDIVSNQTREAMFEARDLMDSLGVPYYPMGGNHDFVVPDSREWFLEAFAHCLPGEETLYSFTHKNLHFCILDAWWLWSDGTLSEVSEASVSANLDESLEGARWIIPPHQFEWIEKDLRAHSEMSTVIAVHYPLVPIPARMRRPGLKDGGCLENGGALLDLLWKYAQVKVVFSGHVHMHFIESLGGLTQVVTGALPEYPTEYRDVRVYADRIEIETIGLSDPSFAARSLIEGKTWTSGDAEDRTATIALD